MLLPLLALLSAIVGLTMILGGNKIAGAIVLVVVTQVFAFGAFYALRPAKPRCWRKANAADALSLHGRMGSTTHRGRADPILELCRQPERNLLQRHLGDDALWQETCGAPTSPSSGRWRSSSARRPTHCLQQSTLLSNQINNNPSWKGQDAARFRSDWNGSHRALLQQAASALKQESKKLLENADQQEKASNAAPGSGGGPGVSAGVPGAPFIPLGEDWMSNGDSPFRKGWDAYNGVLGLKAVPLGFRDISHFAALHGDESGISPRTGGGSERGPVGGRCRGQPPRRLLRNIRPPERQIRRLRRNGPGCRRHPEAPHCMA